MFIIALTVSLDDKSFFSFFLKIPAQRSITLEKGVRNLPMLRRVNSILRVHPTMCSLGMQE